MAAETWFSVTRLILMFSVYLSAVSAGGIEQIFKIGFGHSSSGLSLEEAGRNSDAVFFDKLQSDKYWDGSSYVSICLPDSTMTVCILLVFSYMVYIIISLAMKPTEIPSELEKNPGLKSLLGEHRFRDNAVPVVIRNFYQDSSVGVHSTPLGKKAPITSSVTTGEKLPITLENCVSADSTKSVYEGFLFQKGKSGMLHL